MKICENLQHSILGLFRLIGSRANPTLKNNQEILLKMYERIYKFE